MEENKNKTEGMEKEKTINEKILKEMQEQTKLLQSIGMGIGCLLTNDSAFMEEKCKDADGKGDKEMREFWSVGMVASSCLVDDLYKVCVGKKNVSGLSDDFTLITEVLKILHS